MSKTLRIALVAFFAVLFLTGAFSGGILVGWLLPDRASAAVLPQLPALNPSGESGASSTAVAPPAPTTDLQTLFKPFWETWELVHKRFVNQPVDDTALMRGAIRGMLQALGDDYTSYMDPDQYRTANTQLKGDYEGIGAWVDTTGEFLTIISPMTGSPAEKAGLKPRDVIIKVDGEDMTGVDGNLVLRKVLGKAGTQVTLTIRREELAEPFDVTITRAKITVPSVTSKMLDNNVAYVQLSTFGDTTSDDLKKALKELMAQNPKGLILDLRNNGGGYLNTAVEVVSQFIPKGVVMYEEYGDSTRDQLNALPGGLATEIPLVVLVNKGTASASEITAGAIQDYARGKLVGEITFGKGSVQTWQPLQNEQGAVRVTIAHWLTPKERQISKVGLTPDVVVPLTEDDVKNNLDPQLDKAVELILNGQ